MNYINNLIVIASAKGGVGKTNTATNLYIEMDYDLLINSDPSGTYDFTNHLRNINEHKKINVINVSTKDDLKKVLADNIDKKIIIDCAGFISELAQSAMSIASIVITPVSNSTKEIISLTKFNKALNTMSEKTKNFKKAFVLINRVTINRTDFSEFETLSETCSNLSLLNTVIRNRKALTERTEKEGLSVSESELMRVNAVKSRQIAQQDNNAKRKAEGKTITLKKYKEPVLSPAVKEFKELANEITKLINK
jgi:chromosome partitioning protein